MATGWSSSLLTAAVLTIRIGSTTCCATRQLRCRSTAVGSALVLSSPRGRSVTPGGVDLSPLIQAMRSTRRKPIERFRSFFSSHLEVGLAEQVRNPRRGERTFQACRLAVRPMSGMNTAAVTTWRVASCSRCEVLQCSRRERRSRVKAKIRRSQKWSKLDVASYPVAPKAEA